jgi:galactokinase
MSVDIQAAQKEFEAHFGKPPSTAAGAPGRVNIIGEHTDYNHGYVLPMAIERETVILAAPREDRTLRAYAANMDRETTVDLDNRVRNEEDSWADYIAGVAEELARIEMPLAGADLMIRGDVPIGCGLSSSAALEMAALCMFESLGGYRLEGPAAAQLGQRVENDFLGLSSGIMDQFISRCGKKDHGLFLDCRSLEYELVPVAFPDALFVIANTRCSRGLTASRYNERVAECNQAVNVMIKQLDRRDATHLRDFARADLDICREIMAENVFRRARHVITEDERTVEACEAMRAGDAVRLGELMNASDASLREDYEVTSPELDAMAAVARSLNGCYGARMTGAGFGGCTLNLVATEKVESFSKKLMSGYHKQTGLDGEIIISRPAGGASILKGCGLTD